MGFVVVWVAHAHSKNIQDLAGTRNNTSYYLPDEGKLSPLTHSEMQVLWLLHSGCRAGVYGVSCIASERVRGFSGRRDWLKIPSNGRVVKPNAAARGF